MIDISPLPNFMFTKKLLHICLHFIVKTYVLLPYLLSRTSNKYKKFENS